MEEHNKIFRLHQPFQFAGSLIQQSGDLDAAYSRARLEPDEDKRVEILKELRLRRFSPSEIARYDIGGL